MVKIMCCIDAQRDFMNKEGLLYVPGAEGIKDNIDKLCKQSLIDRVPLFASKDWHTEDDVEFKTFPKHCVEYTTGAMLIDEVDRWNPEEILAKKTYDVFAEAHTEYVLSDNDVTEVILFGVVTEYCISAAVEGFLKRGSVVTIVTDAIMHLDKAKADALLVEWEGRGVRLITTKEIVGEGK